MILEAKDKSCGHSEVLAFNLLDELWFFNNIVNGKKINFHSSSPRENQEELRHNNQIPARSFLTTSSLPPRPISEAVRSSNYVNHNLELEELQGFKDLGFVFDNAQLSASLLKVVPGLREKKVAANEDENNNARRPYLSEAWVLRRSETPKLRWADQKSVEDKKEQLRSWVRAVACNVRQEC